MLKRSIKFLGVASLILFQQFAIATTESCKEILNASLERQVRNIVQLELTPHAIAIEAAKNEALAKIDAVSWTTGMKPVILEIEVIDSIVGEEKSFYLVEVLLDMDPQHPGLTKERWQYIVPVQR